MGRRDPYRDAPSMIGAESLSSISDDWRIHATCSKCGHSSHFNYLASYARHIGIKTAAEFRAKLKCSGCGSRDVMLTTQFVGKRRD